MEKNLPFQLSGTVMRDLSKDCALVILTILLNSNLIFSQAQLLKDINIAREPYYSEISQFANAATFTYFISANELWKTDGTPTNTIFIKGFKTLSALTTVGTTVYFAADDGAKGMELWKSNGTAAGTVIVRDIRAGALGSMPLDLVNANGILYFTANNGTHGKEVWKSNGTAAGTLMVKDIFVGAGSSGANRLTNVNGIVFFQANNNVHGYELWKTNGTTAGTVMVKDIKTGTKVGSFPELLTNVNGKLFFVAADNTTGRELWKSDGTAAGTVRIKDIIPGGGSPMIDNSTNVNGVLYFSASNGVNGKELWKSNGTAIGTVMVKDIRPGSAGADGQIPMGQFKVLNGRLYFLASDQQYGAMSLYTTDGTTTGTIRLLYLTAIESVGYNLQLTYYKGALYFFNGRYLYDSQIVQLFKMNPDGTGYTPIRRMFIDFYAQSFPAKMIAGSTYLLLSGRLGSTSGYQLLRSDGTSTGTVAVKDTFISTQGSSPFNLVTIGNVTYFLAVSGGSYRLYRTDGTPGGTVVLLSNFHYIRNLTHAGGRLFFLGRPTSSSEEGFYKVENATSAPQLLIAEMPNTYQLTAVGNLLYFSQAHYVPSYDDLWRSDGTVAGTFKIATYYNVKNIFDYNGTAMLGILNDAGLELWKSNGTSETTAKITDMTTPTLRHYELRAYGMAGGIYYFGLEDGTHGFEMWRTNGTASGTFMIQDLRTNDESFPMEYDIADAAVFHDSLYFSALDNAGMWALFRTGSTVGSAVKIKDLNGPGPEMVPLNSTLMIFTQGVDGKSHLWASDGTAEGTIYLKLLGPITTAIDPAIANDVMYFNVSNNTYEGENSLIPAATEGLWRSDGTACGTFYFDIGAYRPYPMEALGTKLIFRGYTVKTGGEPFAYDAGLAPSSPCGTPDARIATTSTEEQKLASGSEEVLTFAPNPFTNELRFTVQGHENESARLIVYSLSGTPLEMMENLELNTEHTVGQQWPLGVYIMKVNVGARTAVEKVIKK
jgi:ELWxxDGT repeat protein